VAEGRRAPDRPPDLAGRRAIERLLGDLPDAGAIPRKEGELAFDAPWEVRALGMAVKLHGEGHFPWADFQSQLVNAIGEWEQAPSGDRPEWSYYRYFVRALERLAEERGLVDRDELEVRTQEYLTGKRDPRHH
jgi:nitrile hydratase accessory protein